MARPQVLVYTHESGIQWLRMQISKIYAKSKAERERIIRAKFAVAQEAKEKALEREMKLNKIASLESKKETRRTKRLISAGIFSFSSFLYLSKFHICMSLFIHSSNQSIRLVLHLFVYPDSNEYTHFLSTQVFSCHLLISHSL